MPRKERDMACAMSYLATLDDARQERAKRKATRKERELARAIARKHKRKMHDQA